jgi:hypothetical protein
VGTSSEEKGVIMNERQWELYRLSVVETWSDSPYKRAVSAAIEHKLMVLEHPRGRRSEPNYNPGFPALLALNKPLPSAQTCAGLQQCS